MMIVALGLGLFKNFDAVSGKLRQTNLTIVAASLEIIIREVDDTYKRRVTRRFRVRV